MTKNERTAHRHLLPVDGLQSVLRSANQYVRIIISEHWGCSTAGQLLASCLVNLLVRQINVVRHVEIVSVNTKALISMPNGDAAEQFPGCLKTLAEWAVGGTVTTSMGLTGSTADYTIFVGNTDVRPTASHGYALVVIGDGWRAWIGDPFEAPACTPISDAPFGPFLAAALVAGEVFKHVRGIRRGKFLTKNGYSLWSVTQSPHWEALDDGPSVAGIALPPLHMVGAGAVGNALAYIVRNMQLSTGYIIPIDDDKYDETNLNRCLLAGQLDIGHFKVESVSRALQASGIGTFPFIGTIKSYVSDARVGLRRDVARNVDDLIFEVVSSCVDRRISRQDIQGLRPRSLLGGSTLDLQARSNLYTGRPGAACLACFNPAERDGEKIRALEIQLRNMPVEERARFLRERGLDVQAIQDYLSGVRCGGVGEAAIKDFATQPTPEFSVGFVSLGAGLLLAATLLRTAVFPGIAPPRGDMTTLNFLNGGFVDAWLGADDACEQNCQDHLRLHHSPSTERIA